MSTADKLKLALFSFLTGANGMGLALYYAGRLNHQESVWMGWVGTGFCALVTFAGITKKPESQ